MKEVNEKLDRMNLPEKERKVYDRDLRHLMSIASRNHNIEIDAKEIIKTAKEEQIIEVIIEMDKEGFSVSQISKVSKKSEQEVSQILASRKHK